MSHIITALYSIKVLSQVLLYSILSLSILSLFHRDPENKSKLVFAPLQHLERPNNKSA